MADLDQGLLGHWVPVGGGACVHRGLTVDAPVVTDVTRREVLCYSDVTPGYFAAIASIFVTSASPPDWPVMADKCHEIYCMPTTPCC